MMQLNLMTRLDDLRQRIDSSDISTEVKGFSKAKGMNSFWKGADVIIARYSSPDLEKWVANQPHVISFQSSEPRRRVVVTKFATELDWLFYQLRDIFSDYYDHVSKYDFYGLLAQSAIDYLKDNGDNQNSKDLLLTVLDASKGFLL